MYGDEQEKIEEDNTLLDDENREGDEDEDDELEGFRVDNESDAEREF